MVLQLPAGCTARRTPGAVLAPLAPALSFPCRGRGSDGGKLPKARVNAVGADPETALAFEFVVKRTAHAESVSKIQMPPGVVVVVVVVL